MDDELDHISNAQARNMLFGDDRILALRKTQASEKKRIDLARVDAALERLEEGTFGLCIGCGDKIDLDQLVLDPSIAQCFKCLDLMAQGKACID